MKLEAKTKSFRTNFYKCDSLHEGGYTFHFQLDYIDKTSGVHQKEELHAEISESVIKEHSVLEIHKKISECLWTDKKIGGIKIVYQ